MAIVNAVASGNYSNYAVTFGGVVPQPGDTVRLATGGLIVYINISVSDIIFDNNTQTSVFIIRQEDIDTNNGDIDLSTCDFITTGANGTCLNITATSGTVSIRDAIVYIASSDTFAVRLNGGVLNMRDAKVMTSISNAKPVRLYGSGTINMRDAIAGGSFNGFAAENTSSGRINIENAYHGTGSNAFGALLTGGGEIYVKNAYGGTVSTNANVVNNGAGTIYVENAYAGNVSTGVAVSNRNTGYAYVENAYGNNYGPGGGTVLAYAVSGDTTAPTSRTFIKRLIFGPYGAIPVSGTVFIDDSLDNSVQLRLSSNGPTKTLVDSNLLNNVPNISDVRSGTSYSNGDNVGTCGVPLPEQVAFGIPVDDTVGTAVLLPSVFPTADEISNFVHSDDLRDYELDPHTIAEALNIISKSIGAT